MATASKAGFGAPASGNNLQSFIEQLRSRPQNVDRPISPSFENFKKERQLETSRKQEFFRARTREFNEVYSQKHRQEQAKIESLQQELRALSVSVKTFNQEIKVAAIASRTVIATKQYHQTFLEHLISLVMLMRENLQESAHWLHMFNSRSKKKSYYWSQAQSKGTKFTYSEERQVATSIG